MQHVAHRRSDEVHAEIERAVLAERDRCEQAVRDAPSLDEDGYICQKSDAIKAIRAVGGNQ